MEGRLYFLSFRPCLSRNLVRAGITRVKPTCRGSRAGRLKRRTIATAVSNSRRPSVQMGYSGFLEQNVNKVTGNLHSEVSELNIHSVTSRPTTNFIVVERSPLLPTQNDYSPMLTLCHANVRAVKSKTACLREYISSTDMDIFARTETWLTEKDTAAKLEIYSPESHSFIQQDRNGRRGGGTNDLHMPLQSAYKQNHSTESALLKVKNDILLNMEARKVTLLVLLDLSAAFDTVRHDTLLNRLKSRFGVDGKALEWFASYLADRTQRVTVNDGLSSAFPLRQGVPQGSCLGPLLFTVYTSKLFDIVSKHLPSVHCYADDTQLYLGFSPDAQGEDEAALNAMRDCIHDLRNWMIEDRLMLNDDKTELMLIGTRQQLQKVNLNDITVGDTVVGAKSVVRNLGSWFDRNLDMSSHISKQCASAFYHLHNISRIRRFLSTDTTKALVHAFVTSRVDYCNSLLYGLPASHLNKVQRVLNAAARLVCRAPRYCRITPLLYELHWLPVRQRISFKILLFVFKAIHGFAPTYLRELVSIKRSGI